MAQDKYDILGPLYGEIGKEIAEIVGGDPDGAFMFADAGDRWSGGSIFVDEGESVRYFDPSSRLCDLILEAWEKEEPEKRWSFMEYQIKGRSFQVHFTFPEEVTTPLFSDEPREAALKKRYGDKPVIYPPMPDPEE